ncbi:MAG: Uncharacterized protein G01um10143_427 [Parcubacteria group bacterium Gr01-1014_3]|nr:MAG: Uncharacterized protein G01um10143_427 [Parcubacteria group bacterium Gr01-1014_3]
MNKLSKICSLAIILGFVGNFAISGFNIALAESVAAKLYLSPAVGTYIVGETFTVSIILNTGGKSVNALAAVINFPPDKLQVVSPSIGTSIVGLWAAQPSFDNKKGLLSFQGGVPDPGINTSRGVVSTVTFRAKSVGRASLNFTDASKILLNDGLGTDVLTDKGGATFDLILPPPKGPIVSSETHPSQDRWYPKSTVALNWINNFPVENYSYILDKEPIEEADSIPEGNLKNSIVYKDLKDGLHFFHIKAIRNGIWGDSSHFAIKIDAGPPAKFPITIIPSSRTTSRNPLISFLTTDELSGIDHYELKIVSRNKIISSATDADDDPFFIESNSPYFTELELGKYNVIVRAYDKAGNFQEVTQRLSVVSPLIKILGISLLPRWLMVVLGLFFSAGALYLAFLVWRWHGAIHLRHMAGALKDAAIAEKIKHLQEKRAGYLKSLIIFLVCALTIFSASHVTNAQTKSISPPIITTISEDISNEEIFYIAGKALVPNSEVLIYMESLNDGTTYSSTVQPDTKGDWFYSYNSFLNAGRYRVWAQLRAGQESSVPTSLYEVNVARTAIQFGVSRLSLETLYLIFMALLLMILSALTGFIIYHAYHGRKKHIGLMKELAEAEEAIKKGFLLLRRDLEAELAVLKKTKPRAQFSAEDLEKEKRLVKDFDWVNTFIEKEVRDIEKYVGN